MFHFENDADRARLLTDIGSTSLKMRRLADYMNGFHHSDAAEATKLINALKKLATKLSTLRDKESTNPMW